MAAVFPTIMGINSMVCSSMDLDGLLLYDGCCGIVGRDILTTREKIFGWGAVAYGGN